MQTDILFHLLDEDTKEHCIRTQNISKKCAQCLSSDDRFITQVSIAARYHDIGKLYVPSYILNKPSQLTDKEFEVVKEHAKKGYQIASEIFLPEISEMILFHHENEDGSGYYGKESFFIPKGAQIIHVCDVYDALVTNRTYHNALNEQEALEYIRQRTGTMFNPSVVNAFLELMQKQINDTS